MIKRKFLFTMVAGILIFLGLGMGAYQSRSASESPLVAPVFQPSPTDMGPMPSKGTSIPPGVERCLGFIGTEYDLSGVVKDQQKTFYLLSVYDNPALRTTDPFSSYDVLIAQAKSFGCLRLVEPESGVRPVQLYMSEGAARDLELQRYRNWIKYMGGKAKLQALLDYRIRTHFDYLTQDQIWALQQLGVSFPNTYQLLTPDMFKAEEQWRLDILNQ